MVYKNQLPRKNTIRLDDPSYGTYIYDTANILKRLQAGNASHTNVQMLRSDLQKQLHVKC